MDYFNQYRQQHVAILELNLEHSDYTMTNVCLSLIFPALIIPVLAISQALLAKNVA